MTEYVDAADMREFARAWKIACEEISRREDRTRDVLREIELERRSQDTKWGVQNHPDHGGTIPEYTRSQHAISLTQARRRDEIQRQYGILGWDSILLEEVYEALAEEDPARIRDELIQVAAVAVAWAEAIDRRGA